MLKAQDPGDCQLSLDKQLIQQVAVADTDVPTHRVVLHVTQPLNFTFSTSGDEKGR